MQQRSRPTVHVDSFLYNEDQVDSLCEEGIFSRSYCLTCGSYKTAPLGQNTFSSSSSSVMSVLPADIIFLLFLPQTSSLTRSPSQSFSSCLRTFSQTSAVGCWWTWAPDWELSCTGSEPHTHTHKQVHTLTYTQTQAHIHTRMHAHIHSNVLRVCSGSCVQLGLSARRSRAQ